MHDLSMDSPKVDQQLWLKSFFVPVGFVFFKVVRSCDKAIVLDAARLWPKQLPKEYMTSSYPFLC